MDSVISWCLITALSLWGVCKLIMAIIAEQDRRQAESERAWRMEGK